MKDKEVGVAMVECPWNGKRAQKNFVKISKTNENIQQKHEKPQHNYLLF